MSGTRWLSVKLSLLALSTHQINANVMPDRLT